jgi:hypothetical protein
MLNSKLFEELNWLRDEVSVKLIKIVVEEGREVFRQIVRLLQARAKAVSQCCDVGYVSIVLDLGFFFDSPCEISVVAVEQPSKNSLLNLLVILFLKEIIL